MATRLRFSVIPFSLWQREIAPLWFKEGSHHSILPILNGHGQMQYVGRELFNRILLFPVCAEYEGERIGWTSVYNISDTALRIRGIYVLPEFRSNGVGKSMVNFALNLWPDCWTDCFMYSRSSNIERYRRWGFEVVSPFSMRSFDEEKIPGESGIVLMSKSRRSTARPERFENAAE